MEAPLAAKTAPLKLLVERRFPLDMRVTLPDIRALYDGGKAGRWDPQRDIAWSALHVAAYPGPVREAARRAFSRRAWIEATGLTETPALVVRFCMEQGREIDPKLFLTVRNTQEAWHVECFDRLAQAFGGRVERPADRAYESVFNRDLHRRVLHADQHLDAYVAAHAAFEDGLELELFRVHRAFTKDGVVATVLDRVIADKEMHAAFGWLYLDSRAPRWSAEDKKLIAAGVADHVRDTELRGYHCAWLAPEHASIEAEADAMLAEAGLGAPRQAEEDAFVTYVADARARLAAWGVALPTFETNRLRAF